MSTFWSLSIILFYIICNVKNVIITFKGGRVCYKSILVLSFLIMALIIILSVPHFIKGIIGCIIVTILGTIFSVFDIIVFISTGYFNRIEIIDFIVALSSFVGIFLSRIN